MAAQQGQQQQQQAAAQEGHVAQPPLPAADAVLAAPAVAAVKQQQQQVGRAHMAGAGAAAEQQEKAPVAAERDKEKVGGAAGLDGRRFGLDPQLMRRWSNSTSSQTPPFGSQTPLNGHEGPDLLRRPPPLPTLLLPKPADPYPANGYVPVPKKTQRKERGPSRGFSRAASQGRPRKIVQRVQGVSEGAQAGASSGMPTGGPEPLGNGTETSAPEQAMDRRQHLIESDSAAAAAWPPLPGGVTLSSQLPSGLTAKSAQRQAEKARDQQQLHQQLTPALRPALVPAASQPLPVSHGAQPPLFAPAGGALGGGQSTNHREPAKHRGPRQPMTLLPGDPICPQLDLQKQIDILQAYFQRQPLPPAQRLQLELMQRQFWQQQQQQRLEQELQRREQHVQAVQEQAVGQQAAAAVKQDDRQQQRQEERVLEQGGRSYRGGGTVADLNDVPPDEDSSEDVAPKGGEIDSGSRPSDGQGDGSPRKRHKLGPEVAWQNSTDKLNHPGTVDNRDGKGTTPDVGPNPQGTDDAEPLQPRGPDPPPSAQRVKMLKEALLAATAKLPGNAHAHFFLGLMLQRWQQHEQARISLEKAADILTNAAPSSFGGILNPVRVQLQATVAASLAQCQLTGLQQRNQSSEAPGASGKTSSAARLVHTSHTNERDDKSGGAGKERMIDKPLLQNGHINMQKVELERLLRSLRGGSQADHSGGVLRCHSLGLVLLQRGSYELAVKAFTGVLRWIPSHVDAMASLASAYLHLGELGHAERCLQSVLVRDGAHPAALATYGSLLLAQHAAECTGLGRSEQGPVPERSGCSHLDAAQQMLQTVVAADPGAAHAWSSLGAAYAARQEPGPAQQCWELAMKLQLCSPTPRTPAMLQALQLAQDCHQAREQSLPSCTKVAKGCADHAEVKTTAQEGSLDRMVDSNVDQVAVEEPHSAAECMERGLRALQRHELQVASLYFKGAIAKQSLGSAAWLNLGGNDERSAGGNNERSVVCADDAPAPQWPLQCAVTL